MSDHVELPDHDTLEGQLLMTFIQAILDERQRAHEKHGATSMEQAETLSPWRGLILAEEGMEAGKALNDERHGEITLYADLRQLRVEVPVVADELDKELIQTATMAFTWWMNRRGDRLPPSDAEIDAALNGLSDLITPEPKNTSRPWSAVDLTDLSTPKATEQPNPYDVTDAKIVWDKDGPAAVEIRGIRYPVSRTGHRVPAVRRDAWPPATQVQLPCQLTTHTRCTHPQPEEATDVEAGPTQAPGPAGAGDEQQGPEQEVRRAAGGQAPDAEPAPGLPEPEALGPPGDSIEARIQAVMSILRVNGVRRTPSAMHGLAMQILHADAEAKYLSHIENRFRRVT